MRGWPALLATLVVHAAVLVVPILRPETPEPPEPRVMLRLAPPLEPEPPPPEPPPEPEPEPETPPPEPEPEPEPPPPEPPPPRATPPDRPSPEPPPDAAAPEPTPEPPPPEPTPPPTPSPLPPTQAAPKPAPAPATPRPPAPTGPGKAEYGAYAKGMRASMLRHRRYPAAALRGALEGTTKVELSIDRSGRLVGEPKVARSSGHTVLDEEALRIVRVAAPYGALPEGTTKAVMVFVIPIDFRLDAK
jgi:protein TonB